MTQDMTSFNNAFKQMALTSGYKPEEIDSFIKMTETMGPPTYTPEEDSVLQRSIYTEQYKSAQEKQKEQEEARLQAENYKAGLTPVDKLGEPAKALLRSEGVTVKPLLGTEQQKKYDAANTIKQTAQNVLQVLDLIESGKLTGQEAKTRLNFVAGEAAKGAFGEAGKQFTPMEYSLVIGTIPTLKPAKEVGLLKKMFGYTPPVPTGEVVDDYKTLRTKMNMALQIADQNTAKLEGRSIPPLDYDKMTLETNNMKAKETNAFMGLMVNPTVNAVKGYLSLVTTAAGTAALPLVSKFNPELGGQLADALQPIVERKYATPGQAIFTGGMETLGGVAATFDIATLGKATAAKTLLKGSLALATQATKIGARNMLINAPIFGLGEGIKASKQGGDVGESVWKGMTGQSFTGPFTALYGETPQAQTADMVATVITPIIGGKMIQNFYTGKVLRDPDIQALSGRIKNTFGGTPSKTATELPPQPGFLGGLKKSASERVTIGITKKGFTAEQTGSLTHTQDLMESAISITRSRNVRGIAKELPKLRESSGKYIDAKIADIDSTTSLPLDKQISISSDVSKIVSETSPAVANPDIFKKFGATLRRLLTPEKGEILTLSTINNARKSLNKSIPSSWFAKGMPTTGKTNNLNAMNWTASQALKDIITETAGAEDIGRAIQLQHVSFATEPIFSRIILKPSMSGGGGMWGTFLKMFNSGVEAIFEPIGTSIVRSQNKMRPEAIFSQQLNQIPQSLQPGGGGIGPIGSLRPWEYK